ncbi:MAG: hypothetical protein G8345_00435 [Magnetococcales bacterium]|nr:hypothetical protein [Magnetococcales bacterium]NGZ25334.1 hypothetical protein [Magnetococcales bacterium]
MKIFAEQIYKNNLVAIMRKMRIMFPNNTRQGYAPRSILKPAGFFFWGACLQEASHAL